ncbi:S1 family peptidase [Brevibacillus sp. SAFN-007a]|uniref:S1 family peptidase n=1 Tax=Brevibacillus sp. SAFN-007a TaxID=3436862 RepID=UPI003F7D6006
MDFSVAFDRIKDSVFNLLVFAPGNRIVSSGTGVLIGNGDFALTCSHCVIPTLSNGARFSGQTSAQIGQVVFNDTVRDIAVLQFPRPLGAGVPIKSSSSVKIGHECFVVGFPSNIDKITALSANIAGFEPSNGYDHIRIDSSVNHGNSGGPLFNQNGELVGIVNAKHGNLSAFLTRIQNVQPAGSVNIFGIDHIQTIQTLISEMKKNLNLGIGYAIPTDYIGSLYQPVRQLIIP